jgi:Arc/MetJ-type ribon-helix-helix transcriptional regulator
MAKRHVVRVFRVKMSERMAQALEELIEEGVYVSYADAIRHAVDLLLDKNTSRRLKELQVSSSAVSQIER